MFHTFWKELLDERIFVFSYKTPVVKIFEGSSKKKNAKLVKEFYNFN